MKILHINAGLETGGGLTHIVSLLSTFAPGEATLLTFADGPVAEAARAAGIQVIVLNQPGRYALRLLRQLRQVIQSGHYDVVHTHGARANLFMRLLRPFVRVPWVITVHSDPTLDFMNRGIAGKVFTWLNVNSLKRADHIDAVSTPFTKQVVALGVPEAKVTTLHNGITFHDEPVMPVAHPGFNMMIVARLHPVKDHATLLKAVAELAGEWHLTIVGEGEQRQAIEAQVAALGLNDQVTLTGALDQASIRQRMAQTDLTVLTSVSESFPLVLLESADAGVPVVTTAVGDVRIMLPAEQQNRIVPVGDVAALTAALKAAQAQAKAQTLHASGLALREFTASRYSLKQLHDTVVASYRKTVKGGTHAKD